MSYRCYVTGEVVIGEARVLVPIRIRKVTYVAQMKPDTRSDYLQFAGQTEGWEIMEEVPVRKSLADEFQRTHPPVVAEEKEVRYMKPVQVKEKYVRRDDEDDKYEDNY